MRFFKDKQLKRIILLVCIVCSTVMAFGQKAYPVTIKGTAPFAAGEEIRMTAFDDMLNYTAKVVATDKVDAKGRFLLTYNILQPTLVQLAIRTSKAEFYIEPGRTYDFSIDMDPELFERLDPMIYGGYLQISNNDTTLTEDINLKINHFEEVLNRAIDYYSPNIIGDMTPAQFDSVKTVIQQRFPVQYSPTSFYKSYIFYTLGDLERIVLQKNIDSLYHKYLDNEYLLYENPAYMNFFSEFYSQYLTQSPQINQNELIKCINHEGNYLALSNVIGKDSHLVNEKIRELVVIENMSDFYYDKRFRQKSILAILQEIAQTSHFSEHKKMAQNALNEILKYETGADISFGKMKTAQGANFDLNDFKGKWVYVQIFNTECTDCIREMMIIKELQQKYKDSVAFISLSIDFNFGHFIQFKEHFPQFDWTFVHFNQNYEWLDQLQISTLPDNLLFAPNGKLYQRYAPDITTKLPLFLLRLFRIAEDEAPNGLRE